MLSDLLEAFGASTDAVESVCSSTAALGEVALSTRSLIWRVLEVYWDLEMSMETAL